MDSVLEVRGLTKDYGKLRAVKGIDFDVRAGEIFALIGPNGAGKTTTLRVVATVLQPSAGTVTVAGRDLVRDAGEVRRIIAYLPEEAGAYKNMKGDAYLKFAAELFFDDGSQREAAVAVAREMTGLGERLSDKVGTYSKGMTRRLLLARTMMLEPTLAILDEPTSGLDVMNALEVRDVIRTFAQTGSGVLLSSHNMLEIEYLSDRVAIIHEGVIHEAGPPADLKAKYGAANLEEVFAEVAQ